MLLTSIDHLRVLSLRDPEACLSQLEQLVDYLFCEPLTVGKIFGSSDLDAICQQIGQHNIQRLGIGEPPTPNPDVAVYIASELQASGGHTSALADIIRLSPKRRSIVLVTNICGTTKYLAVSQRFSRLANIELIYAPAAGLLTRLDWLQSLLHELAPATVWLFNHHQDSVAVAAVQPDRGYQLNFYHHGDDRLCLGACLGFGKHFDTSPILFHHCSILRDNGNSYLPLVVADQGKLLLAEKPFSKLVTCTAAGFNKLEVSYPFQYADIIAQVLLITKGRHIHIGRLTPLARCRIRWRMHRLGVPSESFIYIPYVPSVWLALQEHEVNVYLASFPYGGGRTLVEVMGAGLPIVAHRHIADRMIGGLDMIYNGAPTWRKPDELYQLLRTIDDVFLQEQGLMARAWYEKYHQEAIVAKSIVSPTVPLNIPELKEGYTSDPLLTAWQIASEVKFIGVLKRFLWRRYRRAKAIAGRLYPSP